MTRHGSFEAHCCIWVHMRAFWPLGFKWDLHATADIRSECYLG